MWIFLFKKNCNHSLPVSQITQENIETESLSQYSSISSNRSSLAVTRTDMDLKIYKQKYKELNFLGGGNFAKVYKVKNIEEDTMYVHFKLDMQL